MEGVQHVHEYLDGDLVHEHVLGQYFDVVLDELEVLGPRQPAAYGADGDARVLDQIVVLVVGLVVHERAHQRHHVREQVVGRELLLLWTRQRRGSSSSSSFDTYTITTTNKNYLH